MTNHQHARARELGRQFATRVPRLAVSLAWAGRALRVAFFVSLALLMLYALLAVVVEILNNPQRVLETPAVALLVGILALSVEWLWSLPGYIWFSVLLLYGVFTIVSRLGTLSAQIHHLIQTFSPTHLTLGAAPAGYDKPMIRAAPASSVSDEPYVVDDDPWEDGGGHTELYPSQRKFTRKAWWIPGDSASYYEYRIESDGRIRCRLLHEERMGTKSGDGPFEERYYDDLYVVKDGVVMEEAVHFIYEDNRFTNVTEEIAALTAATEWHEITARSDWPELWYVMTKLHVGEPEARHGIRKELERLKRGMRIITERTSQWFTVEHDEKFLFSEFKPRDESSSHESLATVLNEAVSLSGISLSEAKGAHFRIRVLSALLGETKEKSSELGRDREQSKNP